MRDEKGFDFKVLCVALGDAHQQHIERLEQVRPHRLVEIEHFFQTYKALEDKTVEMVGWRERDRALEVLRADRVDLAAARSARPSGRDRRPAAARAGRATRARASRVAASSWPRRCRPRRPRPIAALVDRVRSRGVPGGGRDVRWVRLDGLHLTLRFLGPTLDPRVEPAA